MRRKWIKILPLLLLAMTLMIAAGVNARAEDGSGKTYTDQNGNTFRVVPLGDGRYELWQLVDVQRGSGGETVTEESECKHEHRSWGMGTEQFHWEKCLDCGKLFPPEVHTFNQIAVVTKATCTRNAVLQRSCVCGRTEERTSAPREGDPAECFAHHKYGGAYEHDIIGHWQTCTVCGERDVSHSHEISNLQVDREPTCLRDGSVSFDCPLCGEHLSLEASMTWVERYPALKQYQAMGHDFSGPLKVAHGSKKVSRREEGDHAASCIRCGAADTINATSHSWSEYTIANGTCEDENDPVIIGGTCECGATLRLSYTRHHSYVRDDSRDVEPTCTEPGKKNGERCLFCGIFGNYDLADPLGHEWYEDEILRKEPTCLEDGEKHEYCFRCDATRVTPLKSKNTYKQHIFVVHVIQQAKCGEMGWWEKRCKYCDTPWNEGVIFEKVEHDNDTVTKEKQLDLQKLKNGTIVRPVVRTTTITCKRCGKTRVEEHTVYKSIKGTGFIIVPGNNPGIESLENGIHPSGQFSKDPLYFESEIEREFRKQLDKSLEKYKDD
ncbi:MAG: hypothetical protein IJI21_04795 [Clostridia bacterium]|nr:hypothetical protein [Clostridia bacterium]